MAGDAGRARQIVVIVDVAVRALAWRHRVQSGQRESGAVVIERRTEPRARVMALLAGLREILRDVIWIGRTLEIFQVARHTSRAPQTVVIANVAIDALSRRNRMRSGQHKTCTAVIERGVEPGACGVALFASLREACRGMIRIGRALEIFEVARHTSCARQVVVIVDVAVRAQPRRRGVPSGQRKTCRGVVELRIQPVIRNVTLLASGGKPA